MSSRHECVTKLNMRKKLFFRNKIRCTFSTFCVHCVSQFSEIKTKKEIRTVQGFSLNTNWQLWQQLLFTQKDETRKKELNLKKLL